MSHLRMSVAVLLALLFVVACGPAPSGPGEGEGEGEGNCTEMMPGPWSAGGSAFGMDMTTTTAVDGCTATFSDWNMAMSVPEGATISGSDVTFTGAGWDDCTGTLSDDGMEITGECSDGSALEMAMTG